MKTTIEINGKPVEITLTDQQVAEIKKATIDIKDRVKTYENACNELGIEAIDFDEFSQLPDALGLYAFHRLTTISAALNEGWKPDWSDHSQYKYYAWFKHSSVVGSGFSFGVCGYGTSASNVGSRLCFKSSELAEYAGKQFIDIYNDFLSL